MIFFLERTVLQRQSFQSFLIILAIFLVNFSFVAIRLDFDLFASNWLLDFQIVLIIHINNFIFGSFLDIGLGFYLGAVDALAIDGGGCL